MHNLYLKHLALINYRNIEAADIEFSEKINCFLGSNGMGKTNLLDAIYFLSFTKSSLAAIDSQLITHSRDMLMLQGDYSLNNQPLAVAASIRLKTKKQFLKNKKAYQRMADHIGLLPAVMIAPNDIFLIIEGSEERRRFVDRVISQYNHSYLHALLSYNAALQQRNALLKSDERPSDDLLEVYEMQLSELADVIYVERRKFVENIKPIFLKYYALISNNSDAEAVDLQYVSHCANASLAEQLASLRDRDVILGYTSRGVHKDELEMTLDGYPIRKIGSQGQIKSFAVALKFAQYALMRDTMRVHPLLLLDDIFDRLDAARVNRIMQIVASDAFGQIFITDTNRLYTDSLIKNINAPSRIFIVNNGQITIES